jgi:hypothetical protein
MASDPKGQATDLDLLDQSETYDPDNRPIAPAIMKFVDQAYDAWLLNKNKWRTTPPLSSRAAVEEIVTDARHYGTKVREVPVTVQVREIVEHDNGTASLHYRVRDRVAVGRKART